ncbi:unnamed protein product [Malus baccata var. baccata]
MRRREGERENLGVGTLCVDFLASVASYPNPDDKINTTSFKVQAGGNAGNALTCAARLGLRAGLVADDTQGRAVLQELQADSIDTSFVVVGFNWKAIHKFEYPFVKFPRANHICSAWTRAASVPSALASMLLRLPKIKFAIVTLGEDGCIMLERSVGEDSQTEEMEADNLLESLKRRKDASVTIPNCISSGQFLGTAEKVPPQELLDTTGAGDSFTGAILYGSYEAVVEQLRNLYKYAVDPPSSIRRFMGLFDKTICQRLGCSLHK